MALTDWKIARTDRYLKLDDRNDLLIFCRRFELRPLFSPSLLREHDFQVGFGRTVWDGELFIWTNCVVLVNLFSKLWMDAISVLRITSNRDSLLLGDPPITFKNKVGIGESVPAVRLEFESRIRTLGPIFPFLLNWIFLGLLLPLEQLHFPLVGSAVTQAAASHKQGCQAQAEDRKGFHQFAFGSR